MLHLTNFSQRYSCGDSTSVCFLIFKISTIVGYIKEYFKAKGLLMLYEKG